MRVFDCFLYNGEIETLLIRLHELNDVVDVVVIVEATRTFSGLPKTLALPAQWTRLRPFHAKLRRVVIEDDVADAEPEAGSWARERFQRNAVVRGLADASNDDIILLSDVDEIARATTVASARRTFAANPTQAFGLVLTLSYFALNYVHDAGPEVDLMTAVIVPFPLLATCGAEVVRHQIRNGTMAATRVVDAGWHFSYLTDVEGIRAKIQAFSHQEYNTPDFLQTLDPMRIIARRGDLFGRSNYSWSIASEDGLPTYVRRNRTVYAHRILNLNGQFLADISVSWATHWSNFVSKLASLRHYLFV